MRKIGIRLSGDKLSEEVFSDMYSAGLRVVEFGIFLEPEKFDFKATRKIADKCGLDVPSCHLPYSGKGDLVHGEKEDRANAIKLDCALIEKGTDVGIKRFVLHPSNIVGEEFNRDDCKKYSMEAFNEIAEFAHSRGAEIAVENMITECLGNCADELIEMISVNDKLRVCFDVNHLFKDTHVEFIEKLKDKIVTVHLSDYDRVQERHWFPGEGIINWNELYDKLNEVGYNGPWMYETAFKQNNLHSRDLTSLDFYNNAMEIFSGKKPSII